MLCKPLRLLVLAAVPCLEYCSHCFFPVGVRAGWGGGGNPVLSRCISQCPGRKQIAHSNEMIEETLIKRMLSVEVVGLRIFSGLRAPLSLPVDSCLS